ncbi:protein of unknown function [Azospirillum baldaniorum]|uniref:Uncharacterized protein n=1 Tax=Azospirillum baldaniorum TaxID=1064539 RepID=A0A9P1NMY3_9PROT|nr:protein of unknown function [Azospirillum baldaniorum]
MARIAVAPEPGPARLIAAALVEAGWVAVGRVVDVSDMEQTDFDVRRSGKIANVRAPCVPNNIRFSRGNEHEAQPQEANGKIPV